MRWEQHQSLGFFGFDVQAAKGVAPQMRHCRTVDLAEALRVTERTISIWRASRAHQAPAFSGGVWDSWPARESAELEVCAIEERAALAVLAHEAAAER